MKSTPLKTLKILAVGALCVLMAGAANAAPSKDSPIVAVDNSDLNGDGKIDQKDLERFASKYLKQNVDDLDWCEVYDQVYTEYSVYGVSTKFIQKHFGILLGWVKDTYGCEEPEFDPLQVVNTPISLVRLTSSTDEFGMVTYYASDPRVGSVFFLDGSHTLVGELKNLDRPLGVAIDSYGYLLVGSDGADTIAVYDPRDGSLLHTFGQGLLIMPTAIAIGHDGLIYVTDSLAHNIRVFDPAYIHLGTIGGYGQENGEFDFPMGVAVIPRSVGDEVVDELYVAERKNRRIQVLDQAGNYITQFRGASFGARPKYRGLQSLSFDGQGRLHVLDQYEERVAVINPGTGAFLFSYGSAGTGPGQLRLPIDVLMSPLGTALVTDGGLEGLEEFVLP